MTRKATITLYLTGVDFEVSGDDELIFREFVVEKSFDSIDNWVELLRQDIRWGSECRIELQVSGHLRSDNSVEIKSDLFLFEGSGDDTQSLVGRITEEQFSLQNYWCQILGINSPSRARALLATQFRYSDTGSGGGTIEIIGEGSAQDGGSSSAVPQG